MAQMKTERMQPPQMMSRKKITPEVASWLFRLMAEEKKSVRTNSPRRSAPIRSSILRFWKYWRISLMKTGFRDSPRFWNDVFASMFRLLTSLCPG